VMFPGLVFREACSALFIGCSMMAQLFLLERAMRMIVFELLHDTLSNCSR
jgi:hypothetical protein